jgi:hypothetical protein
MRHVSKPTASVSRGGLTLVEILMSLMVAGIGILSVIVLLPLSFVRSVQATNLTNGTILRYNAQSQINQAALQSQAAWQTLTPWQSNQAYQLNDAVSLPNFPQIWMKCTVPGTSGAALPPTWPVPVPALTLGPPPTVTVDNTVTWTAQDYNSLNLAYVFPVWQANTAYSQNAVVLAPSGANGNNRRFLCTAAGTSSAGPAWNVNLTPAPQTTTDGTVTWQTVDHSHYVIDPVGWNAMNDVPATAGLAGALGNNGGVLGVNDIANGAAIERFPAGIRPRPNPLAPPPLLPGLPDAIRFAMLPDSWTEQARGPANNPQPTGGTPPAYTSIDLANTDLSTLLIPPNGVSRVVLTDSTGKLSQTRLITVLPTVAAGPVTTVQWAGSDPVTGGFVPFFARVESQESRYTWMLTVTRSSGGVASVTVTIFFRRALVPADEQVFQANGSDGFQAPITINYTAGQKPFIKKGGFMFDVTFGRWYRITNIVSDTGTVLSVLIDQPRPPSDVLLGPNFNAVFMRGVVDVYPIGNE